MLPFCPSQLPCIIVDRTVGLLATYNCIIIQGIGHKSGRYLHCVHPPPSDLAIRPSVLRLRGNQNHHVQGGIFRNVEAFDATKRLMDFEARLWNMIPQTPSTPVLLLVVKLVLKADAQDPGADETTRYVDASYRSKARNGIPRKAVFLEAVRLATSLFKYPRQVRKNLCAILRGAFIGHARQMFL
ncbi:hypothetical protein PoMZ_09140 [Pyricularia oryzae]|uniref:Uncharacterized protein n=1 Tax=Pyricularia oryzae TaxID=318829 RepID=A0A4P7N0Z0_PYROR|nr:hypothetical protein PoMZ_09140 [Pyricularia oryzae]